MVKKFILFITAFVFSFSSFNIRADDDFNHKPKKWWGENSHKNKNKKSRHSENSDDESLNPEGMADLIDSPTTNVIDYGGFRLNFRFYSKGGILNHISFGVFRRLNLGASWDVEKFIGTEDPATNVPTLNIKIRVFDGGIFLPSFAIGYDGQGRFFNRDTDQYNERERGIYGVFGRELFLPNLETYGGANIAKFKEGTVFGFLGISFNVEQKVALMLEYDNIRQMPSNHLNAGFRVFPLPSLGIDFAVRNITTPSDRERIVRINYVGSF